MNKEGNQRYTDTEQRIESVFMQLLQKKGLHEITVSEICRQAEIHRTTFYGHYMDVYDLMHQMLGNAYRRIMEGFLENESFSLEQGFLETFRLIRDNKVFFKYYLENKQLSGFDLIAIPERLRENAQELVLKMGYRDMDELYYHQTFFNGGLQAILRHWIARDCKETPEELYQMICKEYQPDRKFFI